MMATPFRNVISDEATLRELYPPAHALVQRKKITAIDEGCRQIIAVCPLVMVATSDAAGTCDVSPRGGPPGFVAVLDEHHLAIPDLPGNNLIETLTNLVTNPHVGLLFVLPGREETLRVAGRAWLTTDDEVLDAITPELRRPKAAIGIEVQEAYIHCAKSFRRGRVWEPESWQPDAAPSAAELLTLHCAIDASPEVVAADLEEGYRLGLAEERADGGGA